MEQKTTERRFYLKISGAAWDVRALNAKDAIASIQNHAAAYCTINALEIGVDVDENGYAITPDTELERLVTKQHTNFSKLGLK